MLWALLLPATAALLGCGDSQIDGTYKGEVLFHMQGTLTAEKGPPADGVKVVVEWIYDKGQGDRSYAEAVEVKGAFPASFTLDLHRPPASDILFDTTPRIGVAGIVATAPGVPLASGAVPQADLIGMAENHVIVYVDGDVAPDSEAALFLGGALPKGYHLMDVIRKTTAQKDAVRACGAEVVSRGGSELDARKACGSIFDDIRAAPADTKVNLRLADKLNPPNIS